MGKNRQTPRSVDVYLGAHNISAENEVNRRVYSGNDAFIHADYNATTLAGDIALIKLSTAVTYTRNNNVIILRLSYFLIIIKRIFRVHSSRLPGNCQRTELRQ